MKISTACQLYNDIILGLVCSVAVVFSVHCNSSHNANTYYLPFVLGCTSRTVVMDSYF